jgi:hypothetical protein
MIFFVFVFVTQILRQFLHADDGNEWTFELLFTSLLLGTSVIIFVFFCHRQNWIPIFVPWRLYKYVCSNKCTYLYKLFSNVFQLFVQTNHPNRVYGQQWQGDLIGQIFSYWAIVYFGQFCWKLKK